MEKSTPFDKYDHIKYTDAEYLFWGSYGYRVSIKLSRGAIRSLYNRKGFIRQPRSVNKLYEKIDFSMLECVEQREKRHGYNFFFSTKIAANQFIDANAPLIDEVIRVRHEAEQEIMKDRRALVRNMLFFDQYRWRVMLKKNADLSHLETTLGDQVMLTPSLMYSNDENDIMLLKLGTHDDVIKQVNYVVLRDEIKYS